MAGMEYTDDVVAKIREGVDPNIAGKATAEQDDVKEQRDTKPNKPSKYEKQARAEGWVSKEEWEEQGKDPDQWVSSREFVRRGELMERIKGQTKALKNSDKRMQELEEAIKLLGEHNKKYAAAAYEKAKKDLQRQKLEAIDERDHETVIEIDEKIEELTKEAEQASETEIISSNAEEDNTSNEPEVPSAVVAWVEDNPWYAEDDIMQAAADKLASKYIEQNFDKTADPESHDWDSLFKYVESKMATRFPNQFNEDGSGEEEEEDMEEVTEETRKPMRRNNRQVAEPSQGARKRSGSKTKLKVSDLSSDEKKAHDEFVHRSKIMTSEEYLEQLEAVKSV